MALWQDISGERRKEDIPISTFKLSIFYPASSLLRRVKQKERRTKIRNSKVVNYNSKLPVLVPLPEERIGNLWYS